MTSFSLSSSPGGISFGTGPDPFASQGPDPFASPISLGGLGDQIGSTVGTALEGAVDSAVAAGIDALVAAIRGQQQSNTGSIGSVGVQPQNVRGLGGLLAYMQGDAPPSNGASRSERGNYVRYAATAVLGIPREIVWKTNQTKIDTYETFRAYLQVYDEITGGRYGLASTMPPASGQCGSTPCSESPSTYPADLYAKLRSIGSTGLKAIDAAVTGQTLDGDTVTYLQEEAAAQGESAADQLQSVLDAILQNLKDTATTIVGSTAAGAAAGASAATQGAATGAKTAVFGIPTGIVLLVVVAVVFFMLRK